MKIMTTRIRTCQRNQNGGPTRVKMWCLSHLKYPEIPVLKMLVANRQEWSWIITIVNTIKDSAFSIGLKTRIVESIFILPMLSHTLTRISRMICKMQKWHWSPTLIVQTKKLMRNAKVMIIRTKIQSNGKS